MMGVPEIRPDQLRIVQDILQDHLPEGVQVWVFGSRALGDARRWSDLDLALEGRDPLDEDTLLRLKDAFEGSALSLRVDLVDLHEVTDRFRRIVETHRTPLPPPAHGASPELHSDRPPISD